MSQTLQSCVCVCGGLPELRNRKLCSSAHPETHSPRGAGAGGRLVSWPGGSWSGTAAPGGECQGGTGASGPAGRTCCLWPPSRGTWVSAVAHEMFVLVGPSACVGVGSPPLLIKKDSFPGPLWGWGYEPHLSPGTARHWLSQHPCVPSPCPLPDTTRSATAGLCPGLGAPGLCRHLAGQAGGRVGSAPFPHPGRWLPRGSGPVGGCSVPPSPLLDQAEANAHADGETSHAAAQTKPEPTAVALGPGPGPEAATPPALGLLGGLGRLLALGGPHRTRWSGRGWKSGQAPHTELPGDADPVNAPEPPLVGTGLLGVPEVGGQSRALLGSQGLA